MTSPKVSLENALNSLPHGTEFRFLDRLLNLVPGKEGTGEYFVHGKEHFLKGHFPGYPLFPGVLLIEAAAQTAGVVAQTDPEFGPLADLKLTAVRAAKIFGSARPGETLRITACITGRLGTLIQADTEVKAAGRPLLKASLVLSGVSASLLISVQPGKRA